MKRLIALLLLPGLLLLSGCTLAVMDRQAYALCMCIDLTEDGKYNVGIFSPLSDNTDDSSAASGYTLFTGEGETIEDAFTILAASTACRINFSQLKLCVLGSDLASTRQLRPILSQLAQLHDMRPECIIMVSLTTGEDFLRAVKPDYGLRMSTYLNQTLQRLQDAGLSPKSTLARTLRDMSDPAAQVLLAVCAVNQSLQKKDNASGGNPSQPKEAGQSAASSATAAEGDSSPWKGLEAGKLPRQGMNPAEYTGSALVENGVVTRFYDPMTTQLLLNGK